MVRGREQTVFGAEIFMKCTVRETTYQIVLITYVALINYPECLVMFFSQVGIIGSSEIYV